MTSAMILIGGWQGRFERTLWTLEGNPLIERDTVELHQPHQEDQSRSVWGRGQFHALASA